jgi:apolipoprotein N-acyltransferase
VSPGQEPPAARPPAGTTLALGLLVPGLAGAACVFGFAPFYAWPVPIVALALLFFTWQRSGSPLQAALSGFVFGLGYFLAGVSWIYVSLHDFGSMPAALAALATFLFCAFIALFPALAGWIAARFAASPARRTLLATAAMTLTEWVRGWIFTGFPWLNLGTSQVPGGPLAGLAPYLGTYGVTLAVCLAAATALIALRPYATVRARIPAALAFVALLAAGLAGGALQWTRPVGEPVTIGLLQGNVPQQIKWQEEVRARTLAAYRRMIFETRARIVVIPETALPAFLDQLPPDYVESLRSHARAEGKDILLGTVEREFAGSEFRYYNSLVRLAGEGGIASYRKRHLVPFGEFIPTGFRWILAVLKIPMSDFDRGPPRQAPLVAAGIPFAVAICYEDLFGEEMIEQLPAARILVNVSNDAWFGESFAADQHLQASQMRALESGRWMVRSTNTGASAVIDERGRVVQRLPAFTAGTLVHPVPPREGATPYVRFGNLPALLLAVLLAAACLRPRGTGTGTARRTVP